MKAIETHYAGYRFRSRLEARWCVFLETLGIPFEYEPEGYELSDGRRYLPDFWLPRERTWLEIKAVEPPAEDATRIRAFARETFERNVSAVRGAIPENSDWTHEVWIAVGPPYRDGKQREFSITRLADWGESTGQILTHCQMCYRLILVEGHWSEDHIYCDWCDVIDRHTEENHNVHFHKGDICRNPGIQIDLLEPPRLSAAHVAAQIARFEFGESGVGTTIKRRGSKRRRR